MKISSGKLQEKREHIFLVQILHLEKATKEILGLYESYIIILFLIRCQWVKSHLLEDLGEAATLSGGAPAGDGAHGAPGVLLHVGGEGDSGHVGVEGDGGGQLQQADVVLDGEGVVGLVQLHGLHGHVNLHVLLGLRIKCCRDKGLSAVQGGVKIKLNLD